MIQNFYNSFENERFCTPHMMLNKSRGNSATKFSPIEVMWHTKKLIQILSSPGPFKTMQLSMIMFWYSQGWPCQMLLVSVYSETINFIFWKQKIKEEAIGTHPPPLTSSFVQMVCNRGANWGDPAFRPTWRTTRGHLIFILKWQNVLLQFSFG